MIALTKGIVDSLAYILDPANKREVGEVLKKNLRLSKDEDVEASYRVSRLQMPDLDVAPNLEAWRTVKRLVAKVNPKVQDVDLEQVIVTGPAQTLETERLHGGDEKETAKMKNRFHHEGHEEHEVRNRICFRNLRVLRGAHPRNLNS